MARSLIAGMLAAIVLWVGAVAFASFRLILMNWHLFVGWRRQTRETRVRLALWLAVPLMKVAILLFCAHALWDLASGRYVSDLAMVRGMVTAPLVLVSAVLMMWWIADRALGAERGDLVWWRLIACGIALSVGVIFATAHFYS
jgi:hypothetical protein